MARERKNASATERWWRRDPSLARPMDVLPYWGISCESQTALIQSRVISYVIIAGMIFITRRSIDCTFAQKSQVATRKQKKKSCSLVFVWLSASLATAVAVACNQLQTHSWSTANTTLTGQCKFLASTIQCVQQTPQGHVKRREGWKITSQLLPPPSPLTDFKAHEGLMPHHALRTRPTTNKT